MPIESLYTEILVKAGRDERFQGKPVDSDEYLVETGHNPLCGDNITWYLKIDDDFITDVRYDVSGCLISKASASFLASLMKGAHVETIIMHFRELKEVISPEKEQPTKEELASKEWLALAQIQAYPTRKKCVLLAWETALKALEKIN